MYTNRIVLRNSVQGPPKSNFKILYQVRIICAAGNVELIARIKFGLCAYVDTVERKK